MIINKLQYNTYYKQTATTFQPLILGCFQEITTNISVAVSNMNILFPFFFSHIVYFKSILFIGLNPKSKMYFKCPKLFKLLFPKIFTENKCYVCVWHIDLSVYMVKGWRPVLDSRVQQG